MADDGASPGTDVAPQQTALPPLPSSVPAPTAPPQAPTPISYEPQPGGVDSSYLLLKYPMGAEAPPPAAPSRWDNAFQFGNIGRGAVAAGQDIAEGAKSAAGAAGALSPSIGEAEVGQAQAISRQPITPVEPVQNSPTLDLLSKWLKSGQYNADTGWMALNDWTDDYVDRMKALTGQNIKNPARGDYTDEAYDIVKSSITNGLLPEGTDIGQAVKAESFKLFAGDVQAMMDRYPEDTPQGQLMRAEIAEGLNPQQEANALALFTRRQALLASAQSQGTVWPWLVSTLGEMAGSYRSPYNQVALGASFLMPEFGASEALLSRLAPNAPKVVGALGNVLEDALKWGSFNVAATGAQEPALQARRAELGEESGFFPVLKDLEGSFLGGAVPGAIIRGLHETGAMWRAAGADDATRQAKIEEFLRAAYETPPPGVTPEAWREQRMTEVGKQFQRDVAAWEQQKADAARAWDDANQKLLPAPGAPTELPGARPPQEPGETVGPTGGPGTPGGGPAEEPLPKPPAVSATPAPPTATPPGEVPAPNFRRTANGRPMVNGKFVTEAQFQEVSDAHAALVKAQEPPMAPGAENIPRTTSVSDTAILNATLDHGVAASNAHPDLVPGDELAELNGMLKHAENPEFVAPPSPAPRTPDAPPSPIRPDDTGVVAPRAARFSETLQGRPVYEGSFDPRLLQVSQAEYQFKEGTDAQGVSKRLQGAQQWSQMATGKIIVHERADGRLMVADGHQRVGYARRLEQQGLLPADAHLDGYLMREGDGFSVPEVRAIAAKKNIQEGSGSPMDIARVLRDRPDLWDKSLPTTAGNLRQAKGLAELSPDAWGMVVNGRVRPDFASLVGLGVPDKTLHASVLGDIIKFKPKDENGAQFLVEEANMAGERAGAMQGNLPGLEPVAQTLLGDIDQMLKGDGLVLVAPRPRTDIDFNTPQGRDQQADELLGAAVVRHGLAVAPAPEPLPLESPPPIAPQSDTVATHEVLTNVEDALMRSATPLDHAASQVMEYAVKPIVDAMLPKPALSAEAPRQFTLIRHGKTALNDGDTSVDRIRGWMDIPLSAEGHAEVRDMAEHLARAGTKIDAIIASDLARTQETANAVSERLGGLPTEFTSSLRPWNVGDFAGQTTKVALPQLEDYIRNRPGEPVPNGESFNSFRNRAFAGLIDALNRHPGQNVAIVTHHRVERLIKAWQKAGQPSDFSIDLDEFIQRGEHTSSAEPIDLGHEGMAAGATEPTAAGAQTLFPGVEPVTDRARIAAEAARPLRGGAVEMPEGGLFDEGARRQIDLLDQIATPDGRMIPVADYLKEPVPEEMFAKIISECED